MKLIPPPPVVPMGVLFTLNVLPTDSDTHEEGMRCSRVMEKQLSNPHVGRGGQLGKRQGLELPDPLPALLHSTTGWGGYHRLGWPAGLATMQIKKGSKTSGGNLCFSGYLQESSHHRM